MTNVVYDRQNPVETRKVFFKDAASVGKLKRGYVVCWDPDAPVTPTAGSFPDTTLGQTVIRPATANLLFVAGIVMDDYEYRTDQGNTPAGSHEIQIWIPQRGDIVEIMVEDDITAKTESIKAQNGKFTCVGSGSTLPAKTAADIAIALGAATAGSETLIRAYWLG